MLFGPNNSSGTTTLLRCPRPSTDRSISCEWSHMLSFGLGKPVEPQAFVEIAALKGARVDPPSSQLRKSW